MPIIYTAQYHYSGPDRLDITVKGGDPIGRVFAPTWDMVNGIKKGTLSEAEYEKMYWAMMAESRNHHPGTWQQVWEMSEVTFVCFCPKNAFCHRNVLKDIFVAMGCQYGGERTL